MKSHYLYFLIILISYSCIKRKAIKPDKNIIGTWVSQEGGYYTWLIIEPNGNAVYRTFDKVENKDSRFSGITKYSLFESKFYVGSTKFHVLSVNSSNTLGIKEISTKSYSTLKDTIYKVNRKMKLKTSILHGERIINFYRSW